MRSETRFHRSKAMVDGCNTDAQAQPHSLTPGVLSVMLTFTNTITNGVQRHWMGPLEAVDLARDLLRTAYISSPDMVSLDARIFARIDSSPTANVGRCVSTHAGARCAIKGKHSTHAGIDNQGQMRTWEN